MYSIADTPSPKKHFLTDSNNYISETIVAIEHEIYYIFSKETSISKIKSFLNELSILTVDTDFDKNRNEKIKTILGFIISEPKKWDELCQINIGTIGEDFINNLTLKNIESFDSHLNEIYIDLVRFTTELYLSMQTDMNGKLKEARSFSFDNLDKFSQFEQDKILHAKFELPIVILKELLRSETAITLKNYDTISNQTKNEIKTWKKELNDHSAQANTLKQSLDEYKTAFNFVGLYKGFEDLSFDKKSEIKQIKFWTILMGCIVPIPIFVKSFYLFYTNQTIDFSIKTALIVLPVLSLVAIFIYYFRIFLLEYKSLKSQILQIELRKTLCRFIQSYCDYSVEIKTKDKGALERFERIIFSSIVSEDEDIPSAYDGIEQLVQLIKPVK